MGGGSGRERRESGVGRDRGREQMEETVRGTTRERVSRRAHHGAGDVIRKEGIERGGAGSARRNDRGNADGDCKEDGEEETADMPNPYSPPLSPPLPLPRPTPSL